MKAIIGNKKAVMLCAVSVLLLSALAASLILWNMPNFTGSRTKNPDAYIMEFENMHGRDSHQLTLGKGGRLEVHITKAGGHIGIEIGMDGKEPVYVSGDAEDMNFVLTVPESGVYTININANHAKGEFKAKVIAE